MFCQQIKKGKERRGREPSGRNPFDSGCCGSVLIYPGLCCYHSSARQPWPNLLEPCHESAIYNNFPLGNEFRAAVEFCAAFVSPSSLYRGTLCGVHVSVRSIYRFHATNRTRLQAADLYNLAAIATLLKQYSSTAFKKRDTSYPKPKEACSTCA